MIRNINILFVTMFGLGNIPKIPGTFGSIATVIILFIFFHILNLSSNIILIFLIIIFLFNDSRVHKIAEIFQLPIVNKEYKEETIGIKEHLI